MSEPYVGELRMVGFNFAPVGYLPCDGGTYPISGNETLFSLLGTTYGGDGSNTFGVPDLRGRVVVGVGSGPGLSNYVVGQVGGAESITLLPLQNPSHNHALLAASGTPNQAGPGNGYPAVTGDANPLYTSDASALVPLASGAVGSTGGQSHDNRMNYLCINFIMASQGIYPTFQ